MTRGYENSGRGYQTGSGGGAGAFTVYNKDTNGAPAVFTSEANRNTYFSDNPSELSAITGRAFAVGIGTVAEDPSQDNVTQWFAYTTDGWIAIVATLVGATGQSGDAASVEDVSPNHVPVKDPNEEKLVDSGVDIDPTTKTVTFSHDAFFPSRSIGLGEDLVVSNTSGFLGVTNLDTEENFVVVDSKVVRTEASGRPTNWDLLAPEAPVELQPVEDTQITTNPLAFTRTTTQTAQTNAIHLKTFAPMTNVRVRVTDTDSGVTLKHLPSRTAYLGEVPGYDLRLGDNVIDLISNDPSDPANGIFNSGFSPFRLSQGRSITIEVIADNIALLGNNSNQPFLEAMAQPAMLSQVAYLRDVNGADELEINGSINITASNVLVYKGKTLVYKGDGIITVDTNLSSVFGVGGGIVIRNDGGSASRVDFRPFGSNVDGQPSVQFNSNESGSLRYNGTNWNLTANKNTSDINDIPLPRSVEEVKEIAGTAQPANTRQIDLIASYTATADDFADVSHVFFRFNNSGQVDFNIPINVVPDNITFSVKEVGFGGGTHRVLVQVQGGTIDGEFDHLLSTDEALYLHKGTSTTLSILADFEPTTGQNNFVTGGSFADNILTLQRSGLSSVGVPLDLNDVNNTVVGLPISHDLNLASGSTTRQVIDFGSLALTWTALNGGRVGLRYYIQTHSQGGFSPDFRTLILDYDDGALQLSFNLADAIIDGEAVIETTLPDGDYSAILNKVPNVSAVIDVRGYSWTGSFTFREMYNRELSVIHSDIEAIAEVVASMLFGDTNTRLDTDDTKIQNNRDAIARLKQIVDNLPSQIPPEVLSWLINSVTIKDVAVPVLLPTMYNIQLSSDGTQSVFVDAGQANGGTSLVSGKMSDAVERGNKLLELMQPYSDGDNIVQSSGGTTLVKRSGNELVAIRFVPAVPSGSHTEVVHPTPANSFYRDWFDVPGHTPALAAEADELFFSTNIPTESTTLDIRFRYFANGSAGPTISATLANVGTSTVASYAADLALPDGESFHITVDWEPSRNAFRYTATPRANNPNFFIFDTQVSLSWSRTINTPGAPATTEELPIGTLTDMQPPIVAFGPSITRTDGDAATLVIYGPTAQIDTRYTYNELFGTTDSGELVALATSIDAGWLDYTKFTPSTTLLSEFVVRVSEPFFGWFTQEFDHNTVAEFGTQLQVKDANGNDIIVGS